MSDALTTEDYAALHGLLMSGDPQGAALAKKLTPDEQQQFFDYQKSVNTGSERTRIDNNIGGMPPELAVASGVGAVRAIGGAVADAAGGAVAKAGAGLKAAASQATPVLKYEASRAALKALKVPDAMAIPVAMMVAGYKPGPKSTAGMSDLQLAEQEVAAGRLPQSALDAIKRAQAPKVTTGPPTAPNAQPAPVVAQPVAVPADAEPMAATVAPTGPKVRLTADEVGLATRLAKQGKSPAEIMTLIDQLRRSSLGQLPSTAQMTSDVAARNATGRW